MPKKRPLTPEEKAILDQHSDNAERAYEDAKDFQKKMVTRRSQLARSASPRVRELLAAVREFTPDEANQLCAALTIELSTWGQYVFLMAKSHRLLMAAGVLFGAALAEKELLLDRRKVKLKPDDRASKIKMTIVDLKLQGFSAGKIAIQLRHKFGINLKPVSIRAMISRMLKEHREKKRKR